MLYATNDMLIKLGIPTLFTNITILLTGATPQTLAQQMQKSIGRIYGISTYTDTVTFNNQDLISATDATNLYLTFVKGTNNFAGRFRLDDFLFTSTNNIGLKYLEVSLPGIGGIDLDKTFIDNPTAIAGGKNVSINLWYIDEDTYVYMEKQGIVLRNSKKVV